MGNFIDITGRKYGTLTVLGIESRDKNKNIRWNCLCDCGNKVVVYGDNLRRNHTTSCGCNKGKIITAKKTKHGGSFNGNSPEYKAWSAMKTRCYNTGNRSYKSYGGRGIKMCKEWENDFVKFLSDMGERPSPKHSLDRINVNGDYSKENCRWATSFQQMNNRNVSVWYEKDGIRLTRWNWCKVFGVTDNAIQYYIKKGMTFSEVYDHFYKKGCVNIDLAKKLYSEL